MLGSCGQILSIPSLEFLANDGKNLFKSHFNNELQSLFAHTIHYLNVCAGYYQGTCLVFVPNR